MLTNSYRIFVVAILILLFSIGIAHAIPKLQIYIPGADYDQETETWIINSYDYDLWVIGAHEEISDVKIALAVPTNENGTIDVTWKQGELIDDNEVIVKKPNLQETLDETINYSTDPYISFVEDGTPTMGNGDPLPPHGVFPISYYEYIIGDFGIGDTVYNYIPGDEWMNEAQGETKKFGISVSGYTTVDIVAYDHYLQANEKAKYVFTPFSHDGGSQIPEPATLLLMGSGLIGLAGLGRRKFKKS